MTDDEHTPSTAAPRLYIDATLAPDTTVQLGAEQTHYLLRVMRRAPGSAVQVFNGRDGLWNAEIGHGDRRRAPIRIHQRLQPQPSTQGPWLAFGIPKRAALETLLQKGTELGVTRFIPIASERAQADRLNVERLERIVIEAAEQCERLDVPEVVPVWRLADFLAEWPADERTLLWCDETGEGEPLADAADALLGDDDDDGADGDSDSGRPAPLWGLMIGPEGGFAPGELDGLGELPFVKRVTLGPRILRAETAAIAALAIAQALVGDGDLQTRWQGPA